jgi:flotillin
MSRAKIPSWGTVTAAPHECLIHLRRGQVLRQEQGGSCFKRPSDTVAMVDTSVHRLQFTADQVTREKTGVKVTGLAVFRVVAPLLAYRTLNLEVEESYVTILREMFVGATRRLVANLSLEDCLTRRKDALATELMAEVAPVVQGSGRVEDSTSAGWGVAIDTIEVQDVRVLSSEVFDTLQAPYREALALSAMRARAEVQVESARVQAAAEQARERARQVQMGLEAARHAAERDGERELATHRGQVAEAEQVAKLARAEHAAAARVRMAGQEGEALRVLAQAEADAEAAKRHAVGPDRLQELLLTETLPRVAEAFRGSFERIVVTGGDLSVLGEGLTRVMGTLEAFGVRLPGQVERR